MTPKYDSQHRCQKFVLSFEAILGAMWKAAVESHVTGLQRSHVGSYRQLF